MLSMSLILASSNNFLRQLTYDYFLVSKSLFAKDIWTELLSMLPIFFISAFSSPPFPLKKPPRIDFEGDTACSGSGGGYSFFSNYIVTLSYCFCFMSSSIYVFIVISMCCFSYSCSLSICLFIYIAVPNPSINDISPTLTPSLGE